jgi:hypothetical protein
MLYLALLSLNVLAASAQNTELNITGISPIDLTGLAHEPYHTSGRPNGNRPNGNRPNGTKPKDPEAESVGFSVQVSIVTFLAIASLL